MHGGVGEGVGEGIRPITKRTVMKTAPYSYNCLPSSLILLRAVNKKLENDGGR